MSKETKFEDAYVASESYCGCKQGEFLQPVTATHANNVHMQGIVPLTKADNVIGKTFLILENVNCMENVNWQMDRR